MIHPMSDVVKLTFGLTTTSPRSRIACQQCLVRGATSTITHFRFPAEAESRDVYIRIIGRRSLCDQRSQLMSHPIGVRAPG